MNKLVTINQALTLRDLGFNENCSHFVYLLSGHNKTLAIPTVDEAIDWIRRKYDVIIYNTSAPYVDPIENRIRYGFRVKYCNVNWGWNQREMLERSIWSADCYAAKRSALWIAIHYIIKTNKNVKGRRNNKTRKKELQNRKSRKRRASVQKLCNTNLLNE